MPDYPNNKNEKNLSALAEAFSIWEKRGRGWQIWDYAATLEPPFSPIRPQTAQIIITPLQDDARVQGGFRRLFSRNQTAHPPITAINQSPALGNQADLTAIKPVSFYRTENLAELNIQLPEDLDVSPALSEQFLLSLSSSQTPISLEFLSDNQTIKLQISCDENFAPHLKSQTATFFPGCYITGASNNLTSHLNNQANTVIADFGLARNFLLPLNTFRTFNPDPLTGFISSLGGLQGGEKALFQVMFQKTRFNWEEEIQRLLINADFKTLSANQIQAFREKLSAPLFAVSIRLGVSNSENKQRSWEILRRIGANLNQFAAPSGNELIALSSDGLSDNNHFLSLLNRTSYRSGMLLNVSELASMAHFPSNSVRVEKFKRNQANTKPVPETSLHHPFKLGINEHQGIIREVTLSTEQRTKHTHLIGSSGSGKSTLLVQKISQDLNLGNGLCVFDPHSDLIDKVIERIPESRLKDVILFDPADEDFPIGFNILTAHSELEKTLMASDLVSIFRRFSTSWGDVMNSILANAVLAFLESSWGGNLLDLKRFLLDKTFREEFLPTIQDEEIRYYWQHEFPQIKGKPFAPLITRLDTFLRSKLIRRIVAQKENRLDFRRIMDERKILLVRLSLGAIGEENTYLLGSLLVSKLHQATLSRQNIAEENRAPFFLYLDEAHHFVTESMNHILSGVRKYKLGLILAHQQLRQFQAHDGDILSSVLSNCFTRICFRLDDTDAERLAKGFSFFTADHLKNLGVGEAIARLEQSRYDFNLKTLPLVPVNAEIAEARRKAVIEHSRKTYAKTKEEVEIENQSGRQIPAISAASLELHPANDNSNTEGSSTSQKLTEPGILESTADEKPIQPHQGRGGAHHQELQAVIKRMAESYGFQVQIEKSVLDGAGSVDVSMEKETLKIAAEVSVTSSADYETKNVLKCLSAGYNYACVVVSNQKKIPALKTKLLSEIPIEYHERIKALSLTGLLGFLRELTAPKANKESNKSKTEKPEGQRLNFTEACEFLNVSSSALYSWVREGKVPFYRVGREYRFDRDELVLIGKQDLSGKRKASVKLEPLKIGKAAQKSKKEQDLRYRKLLKLD